MRKAPLVLVLALSVVPAAAVADDYIPPVVGGKTYTYHQIMQAKAKHPGIQSILVEGKRDGDTQPVVLGSTANPASTFKAAGKIDPDGAAARGRSYIVREPYVSSTAHRIGTITTTFAYRPGQATAPLRSTAKSIAANMARVTLSAKNAADPYPYDAKWGPTTYAQSVTMRTIARHPELLVMMIHATPPGHDKNIIIGSNIGRFGKIADEDDARVIDHGATNLEVSGESDRFETELPLNDASGTRIGALGLVFPYKVGEDKEAIHARGRAIRDEIAAQIPNNAALFRPAR